MYATHTRKQYMNSAPFATHVRTGYAGMSENAAYADITGLDGIIISATAEL